MRLADLPPDARRKAAALLAAQRGTAGGTTRRRSSPTRPPVPGTGWLLPLLVVAPLPPSLQRHGASKHWRAGDAAKREYVARLDALQQLGRLVRPPDEPVVVATLSAVLVLPSAMDDDNALYRLKPLTDWLVRSGYLVDDRRRYVRWSSPPEQVITRTAAHAVHLTITPVLPADA